MTYNVNPPTIDVLNTTGQRPLSVMMKYSYKQCHYMCIGMISLILGSGSNFAVPYLIGVVVDAMSGAENDWDQINFYCIMMAAIVIGSGVAVWIRGYTFNTMSEKIAQTVRYDLFYFLIHKDVTFFDETKTGEILSRISSDTSVIQDGLSTNISMFIRCLIFIIATIILLCFISWKLTLVSLGGIIPISGVAVIYGNYMRKFAKTLQDKKSELGSIAEESISNVRTVKAFANEMAEIKKYQVINKDCYDVGVKVAIYSGFFQVFIVGAMNGVMAGIIYYGSILNQRGEVSVGDITSFLLFMIQLIFNFAILAAVFGNVFKVAGASEKIVQMMQHKPKVDALSGGNTIPEAETIGCIELKNVTFRYPTKKDVEVAKNISFKVEENQVVALVGPSGCGKSSLIALIERFYDPEEGEILFSGKNIKEFDKNWYKN